MSAAKVPDRGPNEELAHIVAERLIAAGVVPAAKKGKLIQGLADGSLDAAAWRGLVEQAVDRPAGKR